MNHLCHLHHCPHVCLSNNNKMTNDKYAQKALMITRVCRTTSVVVFYKLSTAQIPKAIVAITPPNEKMRIGASPPSNVVPTTSPTFLA